MQAWAHSPGVEVQVLLPILRVDLFKESVLHICDNSTAWWLKIFHVYRHGLGQRGSVGYIFFGSVRKALPIGSKKAGALNLRKGCKVQGQIVRLRRWTRRGDGQQLRCEENAGVLIRPRLTLRGAHMVGPVTREVGRHKIIARGAEIV